MTNSSKRNLLAAALIFALTLAAYSDSFHADFHFDDFHQLVKNQNVRSLGNIPRFFTSAGLSSYMLGSKGYRPVTYSSFAISYALSGYQVWGYHALNFLLHFVNAFMVFLIVTSVLKAAGREEPFYPALAASLVFALHPIQTGGVTYVSGRAVLLASVFTLLAFYCFMRFREATRGYLWAAALPVLFLVGLLSKEMAVCLIGLMLAYDLLFTVPARGGFAGSFSAWLLYVPPLAALAGYLLYKRSLTGYMVADEFEYRVGQYLMSEAGVLLMYLRLLVLPMNQNVDYDLPAAVSFDPKVAVSAILAALLLFGFYKLRRRDKAASFFGFWFFIAVSPESTLFPITDIAVEYRLYLPSAGFIAALCLLASGMLPSGAPRKWAAVAIIALLGILTFNRNLAWATEYTLWNDAVKKSPYSARAHANWGGALTGTKQYAEAITELNRSLYIDPFFDQSYNVYADLGICFYQLGMTDDAITSFRRAITVNSSYVEAYANLGAVYYKLGRYAEAADIFYKATRLDPAYALGHFNLAKSYSRLGRSHDALVEMKDALRCSPKDFDINYNLARIYEDNGMHSEASGQARTAAGLAADPGERRDAEGLMSELGAGRN